jgi:hypothetical protein
LSLSLRCRRGFSQGLCVGLPPRLGQSVKLTLAAALIAGGILVASAASAEILAGVAPQGDLYGATWTNERDRQRFLVEVRFLDDVLVDGFGVYTNYNFGVLGKNVTFDLWSDVRAAPDGISGPGFPNLRLMRFDTVIDSVGPTEPDNRVLASAHFGPLPLSAGIYWMGLAGSPDLGWLGYNRGENGVGLLTQALCGRTGDQCGGHPNVGTLLYQVDGVLAPGIPEPSTWAIMLLGFVGVGVGLRFRHTSRTLRHKLG